MKIQFEDREELFNTADRIHGFLCPNLIGLESKCQPSCFACWVNALEVASGGDKDENNI